MLTMSQSDMFLYKERMTIGGNVNERMRKENEEIRAQIPRSSFTSTDGTNDFLFHVIRCQRYCLKQRNNLYILNHLQ